LIIARASSARRYAARELPGILAAEVLQPDLGEQELAEL